MTPSYTAKPGPHWMGGENRGRAVLLSEGLMGSSRVQVGQTEGWKASPRSKTEGEIREFAPKEFRWFSSSLFPQGLPTT